MAAQLKRGAAPPRPRTGDGSSTVAAAPRPGEEREKEKRQRAHTRGMSELREMAYAASCVVEDVDEGRIKRSGHQ